MFSGVITDQSLVTGCVWGQAVGFSAPCLIAQDAECVIGVFFKVCEACLLNKIPF